MQIQTGTALVTNGSATVIASAGNDWSGAAANSLFAVPADGGAWYVIAAVTAPGVSGSGYWELALTAPYAGTTNAAAAYGIHVDFTEHLHLPLLRAGDSGTAGLVTRMSATLDSEIAAQDSAIATAATAAAAAVSAIPYRMAPTGTASVKVLVEDHTTTISNSLQANTTAAAGLHFFRATGPAFLDNVMALRNETYSLGDPIAVTGVDAGTNTITAPGHGLDLNFGVWIESTGTLPGGLAAQTDYRVYARTTNTLQLCLPPGTGGFGATGAIDITSTGTGTISLRAINRGHSAIIWCAHDEDPLYGSCAIGLVKHGSANFDNSTFFIATNTATLDPTTPAHNILINQHQGPAAQQHTRALFDGVAHTTHFPGWDLGNNYPEPGNGIWIDGDYNATIGFGEKPPAGGFARVTNVFFGGGLASGFTLQDRTHADEESWVFFANDHYLFIRHYLGGLGDGWQMYSFSGTNFFVPAFDQAWDLGNDTNRIKGINSYRYWTAAIFTAGGTTGTQTINRSAGSVRMAPGGTTITVNNSYVTTSSVVHATVATNDATAYVRNVVPTAGSFTITLGAAATAETEIRFSVLGTN